ncbi:MAG: diacylglycerol kinase family protein [Bacteroidia bacterium]|nr:diacylglycerol kinase family protein [Bacteroidia bacterium]
MQNQYLFIINTLSGKDKERKEIFNFIEKHFPLSEKIIIKKKADFEYALQHSQNSQFQYIVVNGGDGTINSFLPVLIEQNKILGILPSGSGNGLARSLYIPLNNEEAIETISCCQVHTIDVGKVKITEGIHVIEKYFACAVGAGVDADIAGRFEQQKVRGLLGYIWAGLKEFVYHQAVQAEIEIDGELLSPKKYLILSVMNIPQYGNDFYLCPSADVKDGYLNMVSLEKISIWKYPYVLWNILSRKEKAPVIYRKCKKVQVKLVIKKSTYIHIDGEPLLLNKNTSVEIQIMPSALKVISGKI